MKINYEQKMQDIINCTPKGTPLLLHSCCAPCSSACLETLFSHFDVTVFYYNPNITNETEYQKRKAEQIRFLRETKWAKFLDCDHEAERFFALVKGLESEPERGKRCYLCYRLRLQKTAEVAKANGFPYFCTTLSLSPYKNADWLNEIGENEGSRVGVSYLFSDFKKKGGYHRSLELSEKFGLYRQDFCGCEYSKAERERQKALKAASVTRETEEKI